MYQIVGRKKNRKTEYKGNKYKTKAEGQKTIRKYKRLSKKLVKEGKAKNKDVLILRLKKIEK